MDTSFPERDPDGPLEILLVEDNPGDVRLIREAFTETDRETTFQVVTNGDDAVASLQELVTDDECPDFVLLDLNLPGRDGCDVLRTIRSDPRLQYLPVIILTSSEAQEDVRRSYDANANAYLAKPSDPAEFTSLAKNIEQFWLDHARLPPVPA